MELKTTSCTPLRALITECLPYEVPLELNSRWLYNWIESRIVHLTSAQLALQAQDHFDLVVVALLDSKNESHQPSYAGEHNHPKLKIESPLISQHSQWRAPASFAVRRDRVQTRDIDYLALTSQLSISFLYYQKNDALLYYTNIDRSSLRHPYKINSHGKHLDGYINDRPRPEFVSVETLERKYPTFNSFFVYQKYAFIGQFYDSNRWRALEARWTYMRRLDVSNCFRSIYTHSFAWSVATDTLSKLHIKPKSGSNVEPDLGRLFDKVMQSCNWGETHGICVGPEASRIFADIIFQKIDQRIKHRLAVKGVKSNAYEILRYVDDYFIYSADRPTLDLVSSEVEQTLQEQRFTINRAKTREYVTPFTTAISARKSRLKQFLKLALPYQGKLSSFEQRDIAVELKSILIGDGDEPAAVGASLAHIERRLRKFLIKQAKQCLGLEDARVLFDHFWDVVHSIVFQYLAHPSVTSSMKVVRLLWLANSFPGLVDSLDDHERALVRVKAHESVRFALHKTLDRLLDADFTDIEISHFLSLAVACSIELPGTNGFFSKLAARCDRLLKENVSARANQSFIFLHLSVMKYFLQSKNCTHAMKDDLILQTEKIAKLVLSNRYIPAEVIQSHAAQEIFLLSIASCPYLSSAECSRILWQPWVDSLLERKFSGLSTNRSRRRFLLRFVSDAARRSDDERFFTWTAGDFDRQLYEKEPQFIY